MNTPVSSLTVNDCARGSILTVFDPVTSLSTLSVVVPTTSNTLVDSTSSCLVSNTPVEIKIPEAVVIALLSSTLVISVSLNSILPVLNLIASVLGIKNDPST